MVGEAKMNNESQTSFPPNDVVRNVSDLAHDIVELSELQAALLKVDLGEWSRQLIVPLIFVCGSVIAVLGSFPLLLAALAFAFVDFAGWSLAVAFLTSGLIALVLGGAGVAMGWWKLRHSITVFRRSQEEFNHNVRWLKQVLKHGGEVGYRHCA